MQHAAVVDRSAAFFVACDAIAMWRHVASTVTTPLMSGWHDLLPDLTEAGVVIPCDAFGIDPNVTAYTLVPNATELLDDMVRTLVRENIWELIVR